MFSFHKSDALPRSRQSSIDSLVIWPSSTDTEPDHWVSQASASSSYGAMHSPEQRQRAYSSRRSSVFNLRSRSNTATSTTPSLLSLSHPDMAEHEASLHEPPLSFRQSGSQTPIEPSGAGTRRSLFRGRKGKRLSETATSSIGPIDYKEADAAGKRTSVLRKGRRQNNQSEDSVRNLRHRISSPFDFQHLTHTDRHQFAALEQVAGEKLAADFWAVSASQPSGRGVTGIKVDQVHFSDFSSEDLVTADSRSTTALGFGSPPRSPETDHEWQQSDSTPHVAAGRPSLRLTRSVESFSQPGVSSRNHRHSQSVVGPPRFSSLPSLAPIHDGPETHERNGSTTTGSSRSKRESGLWDLFALGAATTPTQLPGLQEESSYFGHALSTPDDSAVLAMTPPFSPSLEDVDEEPERFVSPRPAPLPPVRTPTTPRSPRFESFTFNNQRSPVTTRSRARGNSHTSPKSSSQISITRPVSQMSDTLGSANLTRRGSFRRPSAMRRNSNTWRAIEESWEDDVDYIYENALEADCDFEWDRASDDEAYGSQQREIERKSYADTYPRAHQDAERRPMMPEGNETSQLPLSSGDFRTSLLVPSSGSVPDLIPTSAISTSTTGTGLLTPSDPFNANRAFVVDEGFALSPSLLVPHEYKDTREVTYEDLLNEYDGSDRHFPMLEATQTTTSSARSSHVRSSRRSSYDSSFMSSAQSSGLWSSPIRRSASSAGSVPELVPSRRARKDVNFSLVVDQLSEQVASLRQYDEDKEDDDITPPGRSLQGRTFFSSEEELPQVEKTRDSMESELKASLELARRGSQRNGRSPSESEQKTPQDLARQGSQHSNRAPLHLHKQALSDGAAKLLATSTDAAENRPANLRNRAATTNARQPMLSLFPTPPRHTPPPNRT